ncbi:penicillin-binding transpeptidase domain-containing protein [Tateyamaria armeniaca]|uniref:Penicillin-binding transpeptidase domain-containing protein n=1 Tax=Tateyamaria armeniaca TaxID=2518930 RepID=A0ABW8UPB8_9RHOB
MGEGLRAQVSAEALDIGHLVQATGNEVADSTIIVKRLSDGQIWASNPVRAQHRFSPASTSKIPHTLIALESGIATPATVFRWDGVPRGNARWNQDHSLESAFKYSAVWVYQNIARTAGPDIMSEGLASFEYGNGNTGSIDHITTYWLDDTLTISASEQIEFLSKLALEQLPLSKATYAAAKDIMKSDQNANWVMRSKTGWRYSADGMDIGWYVGWLDCSDETFVFALNMDMPDTRYLSKRKDITYSILQDIGAFNCD